MKGFIYINGFTAVFLLPIIIFVDFFMPVLGRGPNAASSKKAKKE
jgi:hypothetical protein